MHDVIILKDNTYEKDYRDLATRIFVENAETGIKDPFIQRDKSRSDHKAPRGSALLQATDSQGFSDQGGACIIDDHWAVSVAHCGASLDKEGHPKASWVDMTLSLGCEDRDIQKIIYGINEIYIHKFYQSYRGGFAFDIMALYSKTPFPKEHILLPRKRMMFKQDIGEKIIIPNLGSKGKAGEAIDGDLNQWLENDLMKIKARNPIYTDLETVDGDVARPGASGWPAFDYEGIDKDTFSGLTSHVDSDRLQTTLTPALMIFDWFNEFRDRHEVARQMGSLN